MKYFFILGNNPALSFLEIKTVFKTEEVLVRSTEFFSNEVLLLNLEKEIDVLALQKRLGGVIKIGVILEEGVSLDLLFCQNYFNTNYSGEGRFKFGFSLYGGGKKDFSKTALSFKKWLKEKEISSRWVVSKEKRLSSVVVEQNRLLKNGNGAEFVYIKSSSKIFIGRTLTVQDFKGLSRRDYGRPSRDDQSGMLPPKLAQIMINLSGAKSSSTLLDPFCGSGTVLMESILIGFKKIIGSDISQKAIDDTKNNLLWFLDKNKISDVSFQLDKVDVREIGKIIKEKSIDLVITEPFLGPQRGVPNVQKTISDLENLYLGSLKALSQVLKKGSTLVMIWPVLVRGEKRNYLNITLPEGYRFTDSDFGEFKKYLKEFVNHRGNVVYGREGQKVYRELLVLKYE